MGEIAFNKVCKRTGVPRVSGSSCLGRRETSHNCCGCSILYIWSDFLAQSLGQSVIHFSLIRSRLYWMPLLFKDKPGFLTESTSLTDLALAMSVASFPSTQHLVLPVPATLTTFRSLNHHLFLDSESSQMWLQLPIRPANSCIQPLGLKEKDLYLPEPIIFSSPAL